MFALVVRFTVLQDQHAAFDALVGDTIAGIRAGEPGTLVYLSHRDPQRPDDRVFYECYADEEAFAAHERTDHTRRFLALRSQYLATEPAVTFLTPVPGSAVGDPAVGER